MNRSPRAWHVWLLHGWILLLVALPRVSSSSSAERYVGYTGTAVGLHSPRFLYGERHLLRYVEDRLAERVVLYTCRDGSAFARKSIRYVDPWAPDFLLEDTATGLREGIRSGEPERSVFFRADRASAEKHGPLPRVPGLVADAGFDEFVRANWLPLVGEKPLTLHFLVPSRLEEISFVVRHLRSETADGIPAEVFRLQPAGPLSWFVAPIDVSYGAADHVLVHYQGLSDLRDASGSNLQTQIMYRSEDRQPSDAESMSTARQARLAPCP